MAGTWTSERFPQFEPALHKLTQQHRELKVEPLHLAIAYLPRREEPEASEGIFLFEVLGGAAEHFNQEEDLFEVTFDSVPGLSTGFDQTLHLILTTPGELKKALAADWPLARELTDAVRSKDYKVLHADPIGQKVLRQIRAAGNSSKRSARG